MAENEVRIEVDGANDAELALWDWLRSDPDLRGLVRRDQRLLDSGAMGGVTELAVALATSGTLAAMATSVQVWLTQRRSDVTVTIKLPAGNAVTLNARRVRDTDVEKLLRAAADVAAATNPAEPPNPA